MNKKEILEIRKQFTPANCAITRICGCYVDHEKEKKMESKEAFLSLPEEEAFKYFDIFRKKLSRTPSLHTSRDILLFWNVKIWPFLSLNRYKSDRRDNRPLGAPNTCLLLVCRHNITHHPAAPDQLRRRFRKNYCFSLYFRGSRHYMKKMVLSAAISLWSKPVFNKIASQIITIFI